jgi:uncharacterized protein (TIGR03000 family)
MFGQRSSGWKLVLLLAAGLWLSSGPAQGRGGGGGGGGHGGGGGSGGHGGGGQGHGGGHHGGSFGYGLGGYGLGYGLYAWGYGGYGYRRSRYATTSTSQAAPILYGDPDNPYGYGTRSIPSVSISTYVAPPATNIAYVRLLVPEDAKVWFNGEKTEMTGKVREFESPVLTPGKTYRYHVKAQWQENGKVVQRSKSLRVQPNAWTVLDLTEP